MGKIVVKKKKGRPPLKLNSIKNPNPNSNRRSTRRNPNSGSSSDEGDVSDGGDEVTGKKRKEKKLNKIGSDCEKKRKRVDLIVTSGGSDLGVDDEGEKQSSETNKPSIKQGNKVEDGPSTPLPDKKLLLSIIERLKKKDTYGVFSEPVDPEELPDYHEVISDPMDFSTLKKKLNDGAYANLEQFEKDVFLICSNAMQYNASDTIYFRQARGIQELAKKEFENLTKEDGDVSEPKPKPEPESEPEPEPEPKVVRRGRPPKNSKRPPSRPPLGRASSNIPESTTTTGGSINRSNNDRKPPNILDKQGSANLFKRSSSGLNFGEGSADNKSEDMFGSASKGSSLKFGKKNFVVDESRRNTYNQKSASASRQEMSVLSTFDGERKLLFPIGVQTEHGYARSLSRFAAKLGPTAWKVASAKISKCLPPNVSFGPGWVGDNEAPTKQPTQQQQSPVSTNQQPTPISTPSQMISESCTDESARRSKDKEPLVGPTPLECDGGSHTTPSAPLNMPGSSSGGMKSTLTNSIAHNQHRFNGLNGSNGLNFAAQMSKIIGSARSNGPDHQPGHGPSPPSGDGNHSSKAETPSKKVVPGPQDLNGSPISGRSESVHPDLALQL